MVFKMKENSAVHNTALQKITVEARKEDEIEMVVNI
jgi:hypothetical protein